MNRSRSVTELEESPRSHNLSPHYASKKAGIESPTRNRLPLIDKEINFSIKVQPQLKMQTLPKKGESALAMASPTKFILPSVIKEHDPSDFEYSFRRSKLFLFTL